jgi:hypothetical protein
VPAARREAGEQAGLRGGLVQVKGLWVELRREGLDLRRLQHVRSADETLPDAQIIEEQGVDAAIATDMVLAA